MSSVVNMQVDVPRPRNPRPIVSIGAGGIVRNAHLPAYKKAGFPVVAIADLDQSKAENLANAFGIPAVLSGVEEAAAYAPRDAVFDVAVPASTLLQLLPHIPDGAAVLLQKPMGETLSDARAILEICRTKRLTAAVNFQLRFAPNMLMARRFNDSGALGKIHDMEVRVSVMTPWHLWDFLQKAPRIEILYHSIHYVDLVRSWFGNPLSVLAKTSTSPEAAQLAATRSVILLDYGDDKRVFVTTNHSHYFSAQSQESFVQWEGTEGAMRAQMGVNLDYPAGRPDTLKYIFRGESVWRDAEVSGSWFPDAFVGTMGSLQAYVEGSTAVLPTCVEDAFDTMRLVEAAYLSSLKGGIRPNEL
ncbi:MAG TPA: Gfo/Idh/MocA family oxidoreductase [Terriglobales bacterium]|jgi:predicted dehydrogenase|nr:Gfo/Idh/MocA family oxidoreductase [Terriglobales bacterium]